MTTCTTYEKALDILIKICSCIPKIKGGLWISEDNYRKISTQYIANIYKWKDFNYSMMTKDASSIFVKFNNGSKLSLIKYNNEQTNIRGQRYDFLFIDADITISDVFYLGRTACTTLFPPAPFSFEIVNSCNKCLCKTCGIAYENGGAEGCGDCLKCRTEVSAPVLNCESYYNPEPPRINYKRRNI